MSKRICQKYVRIRYAGAIASERLGMLFRREKSDPDTDGLSEVALTTMV